MKRLLAPKISFLENVLNSWNRAKRLNGLNSIKAHETAGIAFVHGGTARDQDAT